MAEAEAVIDGERRALDMEAGAGPQFAREAGGDMAGQVTAPRQIAEAEVFGEIGFRLLQPFEEQAIVKCSVTSHCQGATAPR